MNAHTFTQEDLDGIAALRAAVYANGWQPIEVYTSRKNPVGGAWQLRVGVPKSTTGGAANTGILAAGLRAVDLDIDDPTDLATVRQILEEHAGPTPLVRRRADSCRLLLVYRAMGETMPGKRIVGLGDPLPNGDWSRGKVEILGNGQQFVAFGTHPDGAEYEWPEASPATMTMATAPVLMEDAEKALEAALKAAFPPTAKPTGGAQDFDFNDAPRQDEGGRGKRKDNFFGRVNDAAMADLAAWVPTLFPNARTYQGGYRVSSADLGRDLEEDLSILPDGIVDWGVHDLGDAREGKRTPIDLVVRWGNLGLLPNPTKAAFWLCERLGREPADFGWTEDRKTADWHSLLRTTKEGSVFQNHSNILVALRNADAWVDVFSFDEFSQKLLLDRPIPRHDGKIPNDFRPREWRDADAAAAQEWMQLDDFPSVTAEKVEAAIRQVAIEERAFHPVRTYLEGLTWDRRPRLDTFAEHYMGAVPSSVAHRAYIRAVVAMWFISAVARARRPGCKVDHVLILEGPQGIGKSLLLKVLAGEWFTDGLPNDLHTKDASDHLRGKWIVELAELEGVRKADVEAIKAFLTRTEERFRPAYGRNEIVYPRQCVFAATTNKTDYLRDETGNRRFWPVPAVAIDHAALKADRDQLWAEAVHRFEAGEPWHLTDPALIEVARGEQAKRYAADVWEEIIAEYVDKKDRVTVGEVMSKALGIENPKLNRADQNRVSGVLASLGWSRANVVGGTRWWSKT